MKGAQTLLQVFQEPKLQEQNKAVYTALKHTLLQTSTVPMTEGNKMKMRQTSFSVSLHFGALKVFLTTNSADTYSPITLLLYVGGRATEPASADDGLVRASALNLFEDAPDMPTLQRMHQIVAQHPSIQARLFLLMEQITITELLCGTGASLGNTSLDSLDKTPTSIYGFEDDYASNGSPGLANFMTSLFEPLEAQGRGFAHGHKKVNGVPTARVATLKKAFANSDEQLLSFMERMRDDVLVAASTLQYNSATLLARQLWGLRSYQNHSRKDNKCKVAWTEVPRSMEKSCEHI